jgi:tetratricopeptide (TPR) repeat protein
MTITTAALSRGSGGLRIRVDGAKAFGASYQQSSGGSSSRTFFSSDASSQSLPERLPFSRSSLGLDRSYIVPNLAAIRQLPEVDTAWTEFSSPSTLDNLRRGSDVFASFNKGGSEYLAVNAMAAECQHRLGMYDEALHTLDELDHQILKNANDTTLTTIRKGSEDILLARAKVLWTQGEFAQSQELCESLISDYDDLQESFPTTPLHLASAMTGKALAQLADMDTMDQAFSVRDYFRITMKFLERHPSSNSLPLAAAHANCGVAEVVYNNFLEETNDVSVPIDAALKVWFQGLQKTDCGISEETLGPQLSKASKVLQAEIQAGLAWGVLNYETDRSDRLEKASEYAKQALDALGPGSATEEEGIRRVLSVVAACYLEAGSAVTAEGLFQSATDRKRVPPGPLPLLELQDALLGYSKLCANWDKREGDVKRLEKESAEISEKLPEAWRGKSGIHGSLWFWTPADFQ